MATSLWLTRVGLGLGGCCSMLLVPLPLCSMCWSRPSRRRCCRGRCVGVRDHTDHHHIYAPYGDVLAASSLELQEYLVETRCKGINLFARDHIGRKQAKGSCRGMVVDDETRFE